MVPSLPAINQILAIHAKTRYQTFLFLSSFAIFLYFCPGLWVPNFVLK